jgi:hypothetical protein
MLPFEIRRLEDFASFAPFAYDKVATFSKGDASLSKAIDSLCGELSTTSSPSIRIGDINTK